MENKNRLKFFLLILMSILVISSFIISPYREEIDITDKPTNYNAVLVLKLIYIIILFIETCYFVLTKFTFKKILNYTALLILIYIVIQFYILSNQITP